MSHRMWTDAATLNKAKTEAYVNYQKKYEQMSKQQQLIEQKKQEILKKQEEKKKKETEEALKRLNEDKLRSSDSSRSKRGYHGHGYSKKSGRDRQEAPAIVPPTLPSNIFTNDGSFFEQFQKISGVRVDVKKRSSKQLSEPNSGDTGSESAAAKNKDDSEVSNKELTIRDAVHNQQMTQQQQPPPPPQQQQQHMIPPPPQLPPHMPHPPQMPGLPHMTHLQMHPQRPMFTPQQIGGPPTGPPMGMNYPPQFNPMMLPPPLTPSSIPPPAPLNPGSIPSPSPLQPCSIPSPSPLQPYAIPPPSPLIPHSIPPPRPMVPHSIPPPSPLMPHSIPPPPMQRPPLFLSMVAVPPPPPPPEEKKSEPKPVNTAKDSENLTEQQAEPLVTIEPEPEPKHETEPKAVIRGNKLAKTAKELFDKKDYSSSSSSSEDEKPDEADRFGPSHRRRGSSSSDSDSEPEIRSPETNSDKESDSESYRKDDVVSEMDSTMEQDSQPEPEPDVACRPVMIEDTLTQFPSGDPAPPDLCSEGDSLPPPNHDSDGRLTLTDADSRSQPTSIFLPQEVKEEQLDTGENSCNVKLEGMGSEDMTLDEDQEIKQEGMSDVKQEIMADVKQEAELGEDVKKEEDVKQVSGVKPMLMKMQFVPATKTEGDTSVKAEEPPTKKKRRSRWATEEEVTAGAGAGAVVGPVGVVAPTVLGAVNTIVNTTVPPLPASTPTINVPGMSGAMISKVNRSDPALVAYAMKSFGRTNLTDAEWKKAEDHYKINLLYQDMMRKREELERLQAAGRKKYEYDSDEDCEGGTWEHKLRSAEMEATQLWADELTEAAKGKHHIGDFLPPDELARFMEKYEALKEGREPDLTDYKEFKLKEDNIGFQMLQKLGWTEGQGLGADGSGIVDPVNKSTMRPENQGLGMERPDDVDGEDDEYDAYRKRMMLAYRFRPNPMNNPRRPYY